jgi:hypothetical protein
MVSEKKERIQTIINKIKFCLTRFETVDNISSELDYTENYPQYTKKTSYEINNAIYYYLKSRKVKKLDLYINFNKVPEIIYKYLNSFIYCHVISNNGSVSIHIKKIKISEDKSSYNEKLISEDKSSYNEKLIIKDIKDFLKLSEEEVIYDIFKVSKTDKLKVQSILMKKEKTSKEIRKDIYNYLKRKKKFKNLKKEKTEIIYDYLHTKIELNIKSDDKGSIFIFISKILEV